MTAWIIATKELRLNSDDVVVVNAGGSSLGRVFAQFSRIFGYRLIAVCRTQKHTGPLKDLGAWEVISNSNTSDMELPQTVMDLTQGLGATIGIDSIGGADGHALIRCVRPGGTVLNIGLLSGTPLNWIAVADQHPLVTVRPFWLRLWRKTVPTAQWHKAFDELFALVKSRQLVMPPSSGRFHLRDFAAGLRMDQIPGRQGKVLLAPWD
jgi:NADPH2:quinone reductase